jgi:hypothetical protein
LGASLTWAQFGWSPSSSSRAFLIHESLSKKEKKNWKWKYKIKMKWFLRFYFQNWKF